MKYAISGLLILVILISGCAGIEEDLLKVNLFEHNNIAFHIHSVLKIEVLGKNHPIPANIGITQKGMGVIHTHDTTGRLHIESPYQAQFYLKDFFTIWNKTFNRTCILQKCTDENNTLEFLVNGIPNTDFENHPLTDWDEIQIIYKNK